MEHLLKGFVYLTSASQVPEELPQKGDAERARLALQDLQEQQPLQQQQQQRSLDSTIEPMLFSSAPDESLLQDPQVRCHANVLQWHAEQSPSGWNNHLDGQVADKN